MDSMRIDLDGGTRARLVVVIAVYLAGAALLAVGAHSNTGMAPPPWLRYVTLGVVCGAMFLRRRAPMLGLGIGTIGFAAELVMGVSLGTALAYSDNLYAAAAHGPRRAGRVMLVVGVVLTVADAAVAYHFSGLPGAVVIAAVLAMLLLSPVATAMIIRESRTRAEAEARRAEAETQRAETIARLAEADREAVLAAERNRMARELHDTIANHFSAIAIRASAVMSRTDMDAAAVRDIVADMRQSSLDGLGEVRRTIDFLRTGEPEDVVQHGIGDIDEVVDRVRADGLGVTYSLTGAERPHPIAVGFAAYRIAQEALTNALKHGRDADARVAIDDSGVTLVVDNICDDDGDPAPGTGSGLLGMRERAHSLGGFFAAGRRGDNGWRVRAVLPIMEEGTR
ncbi:hypothetical protein STSO111631_07550 [Stackebrandtia soli]